MAWTKVADRMPPEDEQILIYVESDGKMELGRYINGAWFIEDAGSGQLSKIAGVTHWAWMLDSEINDDGDD